MHWRMPFDYVLRDQLQVHRLSNGKMNQISTSWRSTVSHMQRRLSVLRRPRTAVRNGGCFLCVEERTITTFVRRSWQRSWTRSFVGQYYFLSEFRHCSPIFRLLLWVRILCDGANLIDSSRLVA